MFECKTKTGKGWQQICGGVATHVEVVELNGESWGYVSCEEHHNAAAVPIGNLSD